MTISLISNDGKSHWINGSLLACAMNALMRRYVGRLGLLLVASLATVSLGCATWEDYGDSRGAGKAKAEVAIFKAHLANTRRIVSTPDGRVEYQYDSAQKRTMWSAQHQRIRLLPGQYTVTAKTWPFGSLYDFEVDLKAGHTYKVETSLCTFECLRAGKPHRHDRWIQDLTTHERITGVVSECYLAKQRRGERRKVPCPNEEANRDYRNAGKANAAITMDEEDNRDFRKAGPANAEVALDEEAYRDSRVAGQANRDSRVAGQANAEVAPDEEADRDSRVAGQANAEVALDEEAYRDSRDAGPANAEVALEEEAYRDSRSTGKANAEVAIFKAHLANTRRIVSASDGSVEYQYNPKLKRTQRSAPHSLIRLLPGHYTVTAKTWPFGSLYEFEVDLEAGHTYEVETSLCSLKCISTGEPYRHDRWIQDLTTGERISGVVSECYLGKKRRRERQRVPCPDDQ